MTIREALQTASLELDTISIAVDWDATLTDESERAIVTAVNALLDAAAKARTVTRTPILHDVNPRGAK